MKLKINKSGTLEITTTIYQAKNGAVYIDFGNTVLKLEKDYAGILCYEIPDFDLDMYLNYYMVKHEEGKK